MTLGFGPSDVEQVEVYLYAFDEAPVEVSRSTITDRTEIAELVQVFTDTPVQDLRRDADELRGEPAAGVRFVLRDGSAVDVTQVFVAPKDVVLLWPDGRAARTERGVDISRYGTPADPAAHEDVDPAERPRAVIP